MNDRETSQGPTLSLQRVRCSQCQLPLIQLGEGNLSVTLHHKGEEITQSPPAYSYRALTDPTPLRTCPRCGTILTSTTITLVHSRTIITDEGALVQKLKQND